MCILNWLTAINQPINESIVHCALSHLGRLREDKVDHVRDEGLRLLGVHSPAVEESDHELSNKFDKFHKIRTGEMVVTAST